MERSLVRFAWLSIATALFTMALKAGAAWLTGSVGLLSDALESGVNLVAAIVALFALRASESDPDDEYPYGKAKAEYLSAGVEGTMILLAALAILWVAIPRLRDPGEVEQVGIGLGISLVAAAVNFAVAIILLRNGREHRSITLEADGKHLMTDVWTSVGVLVAVLLVALTGWQLLDPIIAIAVAAHIILSGALLLRRSVRGLLDVAIPDEQLAALDEILRRNTSWDLEFHAVMTRQAGRRSFVSFHALFPGATSVTVAHNRIEEIEAELQAAIPGLHVLAHIEPLEDPRSFADVGLDRDHVPPSAAPDA